VSPKPFTSGSAPAKFLRAVVPAITLCGVLGAASSFLVPTTASAGPTVKVTQAAPVQPGFQRFAWLNAWADHHTAPGGVAAGRLDGVPRMRIVVGHLRRTVIDFGVLAEVEAPQREAFESFGREYALVSTPDATDDAVFYRRSVFRLVSKDTVTMYYRHGAQVSAPVVVLEERSSGQRVGVLPVHFPASLPSAPRQKQWRDLNARVVKEAVARAGVPMVVAGDFNQRNDIPRDRSGESARDAREVRHRPPGADRPSLPQPVAAARPLPGLLRPVGPSGHRPRRVLPGQGATLRHRLSPQKYVRTRSVTV
jgi:hypothetical protein